MSPYLPEDQRQAALEIPGTPGELNFLLTMVCLTYLAATDGRYADHAEVVGALECCKLEFYRRACVAPARSQNEPSF
jgi:hypothetical protein